MNGNCLANLALKKSSNFRWVDATINTTVNKIFNWAGLYLGKAAQSAPIIMLTV